MAAVHHIEVGPLAVHRFADVLPRARYEAFLDLSERAATELAGRVIWNVNSTARGGGVAELLRSLLAYARGAGVDARWAVIDGDPEFFALTKRIHNHLHGFDGDGGGLGAGEREHYEGTLAAAARDLVPLLGGDDVVILHDPQTAGLVPAVRATGARVIWRCHVGLDQPNALARKTWSFLRDYVSLADAYVFSRASFAWGGLDPRRIVVIQPSIDVFSPKNQELSRSRMLAILGRAGLLANGHRGRATFARTDGTPGRVDRRAEVLERAPLRPEDPMVLQVSRWDRLKDPMGVLEGFVRHVAPSTEAHLVLAGPAVDSVADDPEQAAVLAQVTGAWRELPVELQARVHVACLPMVDPDENAAIVNALQHHATVVVQKSVAEGFGLTVAEAMWKHRPVVASRIGGIQDQIVEGESGLLVSDPRDLAAYGAAVCALLLDPDRARRIGAAAHARVHERFLGTDHLRHYFELIHRVDAVRSPSVALATP
jgi:trehalose synthase